MNDWVFISLVACAGRDIFEFRNRIALRFIGKIVTMYFLMILFAVISMPSMKEAESDMVQRCENELFIQKSVTFLK